MPVSREGPRPSPESDQDRQDSSSSSGNSNNSINWTPSLAIHARNFHTRNLRLCTSDLRRLYNWSGNHTHDQSFGHFGHQEAQRHFGDTLPAYDKRPVETFPPARIIIRAPTIPNEVEEVEVEEGERRRTSLLPREPGRLELIGGFSADGGDRDDRALGETAARDADVLFEGARDRHLYRHSGGSGTAVDQVLVEHGPDPDDEDEDDDEQPDTEVPTPIPTPEAAITAATAATDTDDNNTTTTMQRVANMLGDGTDLVQWGPGPGEGEHRPRAGGDFFHPGRVVNPFSGANDELDRRTLVVLSTTNSGYAECLALCRHPDHSGEERASFYRAHAAVYCCGGEGPPPPPRGQASGCCSGGPGPGPGVAVAAVANEAIEIRFKSARFRMQDCCYVNLEHTWTIRPDFPVMDLGYVRRDQRRRLMEMHARVQMELFNRNIEEHGLGERLRPSWG